MAKVKYKQAGAVRAARSLDLLLGDCGRLSTRMIGSLFKTQKNIEISILGIKCRLACSRRLFGKVNVTM